MFRKAILERYSLMAAPLKNNDESVQALSGFFSDSAFLGIGANDFIIQMIGRLESVQEYDHVESDRHLRKKIILALGQEIALEERRKQRAQDELEAMRLRSEVLEETVDAGAMAGLEETIRSATALIERATAEKQQKEDELDEMERVWEQQEFDYEEREKAIEWMKTLPGGQEGLIQFLNGLTDKYVRAFAMFITIHDPLHYTVRWFDNTETEVEMFSNVEGWKYTSDYWNGTSWRRKPRSRKK